jgi:hypothetical protein
MLNQESKDIGPIVSSLIGWVKTKEKKKKEGEGRRDSMEIIF